MRAIALLKQTTEYEVLKSFRDKVDEIETERSYSEEEVLAFCEWFAYEIEHYNYPKNKDIVKALEQFKKT